MSNPLSMFHEKDDPSAPWSMTRVTQMIFTLAIAYGIVRMANNATLHSVAWPFAFLAGFTLGATPFQSFLKNVQSWAMTPTIRGPLLAAVASAITKIPSLIGGGVPGTTAITETKSSVTTTVAPDAPDAPASERGPD